MTGFAQLGQRQLENHGFSPAVHAVEQPVCRGFRSSGCILGLASALPARSVDHLSTRQHVRLIDEWVSGMGGSKEDYGTPSLRLTSPIRARIASSSTRATSSWCSELGSCASRSKLLGAPTSIALAIVESDGPAIGQGGRPSRVARHQPRCEEAKAMAERSLRTQPPPEPFSRGPYKLALCVAAIVLGLDQLAKFIVTYKLALPRRGTIDLVSFFGFRWEENTGVSMNFLRAGDEVGRWLLVGFTSLICAGIALWLGGESRRDTAVALAMILGGALGNIIDRVRHGFVVDFADLHFGGWRPFLIFNLADAAISIGVVLLLATSIFARKRQPH